MSGCVAFGCPVPGPWKCIAAAATAVGSVVLLLGGSIAEMIQDPGIAGDPDAESVALLDRIAAGDRAAFRRLYDLHAPRLHAIAQRITRQGPLAADAVHDAFLQVWRNAGRFDANRGNPQAWLLSLVRYRALDIARRRGREVSDEGLPEPVDDTPDVLSRMVADGDAAALHACLGQLHEERRRLILLAFVDGLTHVDLAERMAMPLGTVKSWIRRSLAALRGCLETPEAAR